MYKIVYGKRLSQNPMDIEVEMSKPKVHVEEHGDEDIAFKKSKEIMDDINLILLFVYESMLGAVLFKNTEMGEELTTHIEKDVLGINNSLDSFNFDLDEY